MALSDHLSSVKKLRARIVSVDTTQNMIDVITVGGPQRITVWEVPADFRWPIEGEDWSIYEENGYWYLGNRANEPTDKFSINQMDPGAMRLDSDKIYDKNGIRIDPVDIDNRLDDIESALRIPVVSSIVAGTGPIPNPIPDGFEIIYRFVPTTTPASTIPRMWHLKYDLGSNLWLPVGEQVPIDAREPAQLSIAFNTAIWGTVAALNATIPLKGIYRVDTIATHENDSGNCAMLLNVFINNVSPSGSGNETSSVGYASVATSSQAMPYERELTEQNAGIVIAQAFRHNGPNPSTIWRNTAILKLYPVAITPV